VEWIRRTRNQIEAGLSYAGAQSTLNQFLKEWLDSIRNTLKPKTWSQYKQVTEQHVIPELGKIKLKNIRPDQIQSFYNTMTQAGYSSSTIRIIHAVLHRALNQALKWGLIPRNPASVVSRPRVKRRKMRVLSIEQVQSLLIAAQ
jgi:integrase